jgi:predicted MPP superfamily phosphohydrolase
MRGASPSVVLLAHTPTRLTEATSLAVPLVIGGHACSGQSFCRVSGHRRPQIPRDRRHRQAENTSIFVSRGGNGYTSPFAELPAQVALLTLNRSLSPEAKQDTGFRLTPLRGRSLTTQN